MADASQSSRKPTPAPAEPAPRDDEPTGEPAVGESRPAELGREEFARLRRILRRKYH